MISHFEGLKFRLYLREICSKSQGKSIDNSIQRRRIKEKGPEYSATCMRLPPETKYPGNSRNNR